MPILRDFFGYLFGYGESNDRSSRDSERKFGERFRNPIWQNDEEDDDEYGDDYRHPGQPNRSFHFEIFTSPFEMTKYFESQMDNLMKDFFSFGFKNGQVFENLPGLMPPNEEKNDPRDEVLKPGYGLPSPNYGVDSPRVDNDLDGKINAKDFPAVWDDRVTHGPLAIPEHQPRFFSSSTFGQSIVCQTIRRPDGSVEEKKTIKDNEGNVKTIIKHLMGDRSHTVVITTDKDGVETKTESFDNVDPKDTENFSNKWNSIEQHPIEPGTLTRFPWHKFFDFNPKL